MGGVFPISVVGGTRGAGELTSDSPDPTKIELDRNSHVDDLRDILMGQSTCTMFAVSSFALLCERPGRSETQLIFRDITFIKRQQMRDHSFVVFVGTDNHSFFTYPLSGNTSSRKFVEDLLWLWIVN